MSGINYIHDKALTKMREDFLECNRKFKHIKHLYSLECANSSKLEKKLKSVMHHKELMAREIFDLKKSAEKRNISLQILLNVIENSGRKFLVIEQRDVKLQITRINFLKF